MQNFQRIFHFNLLDIKVHFIFKFLSTLDISKSTGLDSIGPRLLKISSPVITNSITFIGQNFISKVCSLVVGNKLKLTYYLKVVRRMR